MFCESAALLRVNVSIVYRWWQEDSSNTRQKSIVFQQLGRPTKASKPATLIGRIHNYRGLREKSTQVTPSRPRLRDSFDCKEKSLSVFVNMEDAYSETAVATWMQKQVDAEVVRYQISSVGY